MPYPARIVAVLLAVALPAAACGSETEPNSGSLSTVETPTTSEATEA